MLSCDKVSFARELILFEGLGFCLRPATAIGLKGANGSGKTTLLRGLAGLSPTSSGDIRWMGEDVRGNADYQSLMLYIAHQNASKPEISVYDNLQYFAALKGTQMLVPAAMQYFQLTQHAHTPVAQLSAGWQRRVALARLLAIPAMVWLLDEPTANLDAEGSSLLEGLISTRLQQGGIVIMTSHQAFPTHVRQIIDLNDFLPQRRQKKHD